SSNYPTLTPAKWKLFWSLPLSHVARNIWYRFLHHSISSASLLHHIMPDIVPSASCRLCSHPDQTADHLLTSCPKIWKVWDDVLTQWLPSFSSSPRSVGSVILTVTPPPDGPLLPSSQIFGAILQVGWRAYWALVFDNVSFVPATVSASAHSFLHTCVDQISI
ncbi:hypothetical protein CLU79DRAFT_688212, partial [Phycomyces nitens]